MASQRGKSMDLEHNCVLCCQEVEIYAVGKCDHPICYRCSTKMRVLCEQKYCAVCREELDKVIFVKQLAPFSSLNTQPMHSEKRYDIYSDDVKIFAQLRRLLQHECTLCPELRPFHAFPDLEQHMRRNHELFCCKLCVKFLKNFTYERKWYSRKDLARHRIHGDPEDTSHRGHPLCKFCDERYLDNDELLKHLRRDHYFCHFCDSDGAQEYYSDYSFLREHFRESHFLCEEDNCRTEQFTHAFRSEIDYKAHKTSCHSKSRAEARQNRQIDLQFNYAPRHNRRNDGGVVGGEDYEEVDRFNRHVRVPRGGARGGQQNRRGSWRYKREEEDREVAAAVRASVAARRQEETGRKQPLENLEISKYRREETREPEEGRKTKLTPKPPADNAGCEFLVKQLSLGPKETAKAQNVSNGTLTEEDFPVFGFFTATAPLLSSVKPAQVKLKEEDFPSLSVVSTSSSSSSSNTTSSSTSSAPAFSSGLAYTASTRSSNRFQEEDFPALVSNLQPNRTMSSVTSAWTASSSKNPSKPTAPSVTSSNKAGKKTLHPTITKPASKKPAKVSSHSEEEDDGTGITQQEFRNAPTMFDISKLLTTPPPQSSAKVGKKKRVGSEKQNNSITSQQMFDKSANSSLKENATEIERTPTPPASTILGDKSNTVANGPTEKKASENISILNDPPGFKKAAVSVPQYSLHEEEFPALVNKNVFKLPPPGFSPVVTVAPIAPPPGLSASVGKPPPGFSNISPITQSAEPEAKPVKESPFCTRAYLVPENFQQRNIYLINSIKDFLDSDESRFNEFKSHSGKFRQGLISASEYYKSCRKLLGENFSLIFNELLVLLPDTAKQQELLSAHRDSSSEDKPVSNKSKKGKKGAWKTDSNTSDLDYSTCPSCSQVLSPRDVGYHKTLHIEDNDFPSLQAISRIIS
ncbi:E3 ubiquitin- ligase ZNF598 [Pelobates cultripes]|uniref:RING-type E3 ubiquitin transferase n=1 Tax=Pelobates cultripes TaxID=61616 RepID=A0AAD1WIM4_PELCU|nr:E3 ubiquitin- ligase ZNF598 [Pelobates cultripes]